MADAQRAPSAEEDPRVAMARRRLEAARAELAGKDAAKPRTERRRVAAARAPRLSDLVPSLSPTVLVHAILLAIALTLASLALVLCYDLLNRVFVAGRVIALPTGVMLAVALSYASGCYLGIVESTSHGRTTVDDALHGDWRDWFWSLPMSLGMALLAGVIGYVLGLLAPDNLWTVVGMCIFVLYPILQLSSLETGSPVTPISPPVMGSLVRRPLAWLAFYAATVTIALAIIAAARAAWRDPPYVTMLIMGPLITVALLVYGWLLGQLARWISVQPSESVEE
jgi:hypothetical protein